MRALSLNDMVVVAVVFFFSCVWWAVSRRDTECKYFLLIFYYCVIRCRNMKPKPPPKKNSKARAVDQRQTSISMQDRVFDLGKQMAEEDGRNFSNFVERLIIEAAKKAGKLTFFIALPLFALFHLTRSPKNWSASSLKQTAVVAWVKIQALK